MSSFRHLAVAAAFCCFAMPAAYAQVTTLNYNLALSDAVIPDYHFDSGQPCAIHTGLSPTRYRTLLMTVSTGGNYTFEDQFVDGHDASLGIYSGPFSVASPVANCVASVDDNLVANLTPGTYTLVLTSLTDVGQIPGAYGYTIDGPAAVSLMQPNTNTTVPVPTMAEWSLAMLAALVAAVGFGSLRRRRI